MTPSDTELLRIEILKLLTANRDTRFHISVIVDRLCRQVPHVTFDETDIAESLAMFEGLALVERIKSPLYGPPQWQITQQGVLFYETTRQ